MNNRFLLVLAACVILFVGVIFFTKKENGSNGSSSNSSGQTSNHVIGGGSTGVVLVEYGDFECPACYQFYPVIEQVKAKYKDEITFQFKHFPLVDIHQNALVAARASEAAAMQDKFWEMYSALYTNQQSWTQTTDPTPQFESFAKQLGMDVEKFKTDLKSQATNDIVQADVAEAKEKGLNSTPTFFLDGEKLTDARDTVEYFSEKIDAAIAAKEKNNQ